MSFYVTLKDHGRVGWLAGPFRRLGDASRMVPAAAREASNVDSRAPWYEIGTARDRCGHDRRGILNEALGLMLDGDGFVVICDPPRLIVNRRVVMRGSGPAPRRWVTCTRRRRGVGCPDERHYHPLEACDAGNG